MDEVRREQGKGRAEFTGERNVAQNWSGLKVALEAWRPTGTGQGH